MTKATDAITLAVAMSKFFKSAEQSIGDFSRELKTLSNEDKKYFADLLRMKGFVILDY